MAASRAVRVAQAGVLIAGGERARHAARASPSAARRVAADAARPRSSSGRSVRAALTFGPAMWQWTSTPAGHHDVAPGVDRPIGRAAGSAGGATTRPSAIQTSRTSSSTPLAGSTTRPAGDLSRPVMRARSPAARLDRQPDAAEDSCSVGRPRSAAGAAARRRPRGSTVPPPSIPGVAAWRSPRPRPGRGPSHPGPRRRSADSAMAPDDRIASSVDLADDQRGVALAPCEAMAAAEVSPGHDAGTPAPKSTPEAIARLPGR